LQEEKNKLLEQKTSILKTLKAVPTPEEADEVINISSGTSKKHKKQKRKEAKVVQ
jgi:hypothetical protein